MAEHDAAEIQQDREQRRAAERVRIEREREARRAEAARLRSARARPPATSGREGPRSGRRATEATAAPEAARAIGGPLLVPALASLLATDPTDRFDLQGLNALELAGLVRTLGDDPERLRELSERAAALMARVKPETDDVLTAGSFLRERVLEWYRESPSSADWPGQASPRWSGLFSDSRSSGGKLRPWLNLRLRALRAEASRAGRVGARLRSSLLPDRRDQAATSRTPHQQIVAEVAQALLDDLAARPREAGAPSPLVHLSELAVRRQVATVNDALAALFNCPESGPFVILHPNRYPDCEELVLRAPVSGASGAALAYRLVPGPQARRPGSRGGKDAGGPGEPGEVGGPGEASDPDDAGTTVWDAEGVEPSTWVRLAERRRRERRRLESPPKDYRGRAAYEPLRALVVESPEFRKLFLAVKWRGRPAGLPLLATLLQRGKLVPEVATDHEYLEAELEGLLDGEGASRPGPDAWTFGGWTVRREGSHAEGFRYVASQDPAGSLREPAR